MAEETKVERHPLFNCDIHTYPFPLQPARAKPTDEGYLWLSMRQRAVEAVVYHSPCPDGFAAALVAYYFNPKLEFYPTSHQDMASLAPKLKGKRVLFLDIAASLANLKTLEMEDYAVLDHHVSAQRDLEKVPLKNKVFDMDLSGVGLAWNYFFYNQRMPLFFEYIQARDLWKHEDMEGCSAFTTGRAALVPNCAQCWTNMVNNSYELMQLINLGRRLEEQHKQKVQGYVRKAVERSFMGHRAWVVNCTDRACTSDVGAALVSEDGHQDDIALIFVYDMKTSCYLFSMRSLQPTGPDVSLIAQELGGGGHKHSAGFTWKHQLSALLH